MSPQRARHVSGLGVRSMTFGSMRGGGGCTGAWLVASGGMRGGPAPSCLSGSCGRLCSVGAEVCPGVLLGCQLSLLLPAVDACAGKECGGFGGCTSGAVRTPGSG